jgi:hypothetical protein
LIGGVGTLVRGLKTDLSPLDTFGSKHQILNARPTDKPLTLMESPSNTPPPVAWQNPVEKTGCIEPHWLRGNVARNTRVRRTLRGVVRRPHSKDRKGARRRPWTSPESMAASRWVLDCGSVEEQQAASPVGPRVSGRCVSRTMPEGFRGQPQKPGEGRKPRGQSGVPNQVRKPPAPLCRRHRARRAERVGQIDAIRNHHHSGAAL